jgi:hypothetical protein
MVQASATGKRHLSRNVFPPMGGLRLSTDFPNVHNLAWKMAAVEKGWANDASNFLDLNYAECQAGKCLVKLL